MKKIFLSVILSMILSTGIKLESKSQEIPIDKTNNSIDVSMNNEDIAIETINTYLLDLINELRIENSLEILKSEEWLEDIASIRAVEATTCWSHTRPDGTNSLDMIPKNKWAGENLSYYTYSTFNYTNEECKKYVEDVFKMLCESPTHYNNMVFSEFKTIGIQTNISITETGKVKLCSAYIFSN